MHSLKVRYVCVGMLNTLFGFGAYTVLMVLIPRSYYILALTLATIISGLQSYATQRIFVWKSTSNARIEFVKFITVLVGHFVLNMFILFFCVEFFEMDPLRSQYVIGSILIVFTYFVHRHWTFKVKI